MTASSLMDCLQAVHTYEQFSHTGRPSVSKSKFELQSTAVEHFAHTKLYDGDYHKVVNDNESWERAGQSREIYHSRWKSESPKAMTEPSSIKRRQPVQGGGCWSM